MISEQYRTFNDKVHELMAEPYHFRYTAKGLPYYKDDVQCYIFAPSSAEDDNNVIMRLKYGEPELTAVLMAQQYIQRSNYDTRVSLSLDISADPEDFGPVALNATEPEDMYFPELSVSIEQCVVTLLQSGSATIYSIEIETSELHASHKATPIDTLKNAICYGTALEVECELNLNKDNERLHQSDSIQGQIIKNAVVERINHDYLNRQQHEVLFDLFSEQGWLTDVDITDALNEDVRAQVLADNMIHTSLNRRSLSL